MIAAIYPHVTPLKQREKLAECPKWKWHFHPGGIRA